MPAPSFIQEAETAWNSATEPKTTASFNVLAGDVLVAFAIAENFLSGDNAFTVSGGSLSWDPEQEVQVDSHTRVAAWTAVVDSDKSMTVSFNGPGAAGRWFGGNVLTFRGSDGAGASNKGNATSDASEIDLTTTQDNSVVVVAQGDWNAVDGAARTHLTADCGSASEQTYFHDGAHYAAYGWYHADAGAAVAGETVGVDTPNGQKWSIVAVEVKGTAGAPVKAYVRRHGLRPRPFAPGVAR